MALLEDLTNRAKATYPRILLPESSDARVLEAATLLSSQKIAQVVLLDSKTDTTHGIEFINPKDEDLKLEYAKTLYERRKHKGIDLKEALDLLSNTSVFA
ncbi:uncharacterized protein METZ01_LOCUS206286, partial [marine metagenome]